MCWDMLETPCIGLQEPPYPVGLGTANPGRASYHADLEAHALIRVISTAGMVPAQLLLLHKSHGHSWYGASPAEAL